MIDKKMTYERSEEFETLLPGDVILDYSADLNIVIAVYEKNGCFVSLLLYHDDTWTSIGTSTLSHKLLSR